MGEPQDPKKPEEPRDDEAAEDRSDEAGAEAGDDEDLAEDLEVENEEITERIRGGRRAISIPY